MRTNLKMFRVKVGLSQEDMSKRIGCSRATYSAIERGARTGNLSFWNKLSMAFALPSNEMHELFKTDDE